MSRSPWLAAHLTVRGALQEPGAARDQRLPLACASALPAMLRFRADERPSCSAFDAFAATFGLVTFDEDFFAIVMPPSSPTGSCRLRPSARPRGPACRAGRPQRRRTGAACPPPDGGLG